jgi:hypothetical protein
MYKDAARELGLILRAAPAIRAPVMASEFVLSLPDKGFCELVRARPEPVFPKWGS